MQKVKCEKHQRPLGDLGLPFLLIWQYPERPVLFVRNGPVFCKTGNNEVIREGDVKICFTYCRNMKWITQRKVIISVLCYILITALFTETKRQFYSPWSFICVLIPLKTFPLQQKPLSGYSRVEEQEFCGGDRSDKVTALQTFLLTRNVRCSVDRDLRGALNDRQKLEISQSLRK